MLALLFCVHRLLPAGTLTLRRGLPSVIALRGIAAAAFFACEAYLPLLLQRERGLSPSWAGAVLSLGALGWFAGSCCRVTSSAAGHANSCCALARR